MTIPIIKQRNLWWAMSSLLVIVGIVSMVLCWRQFNFPLKPGLDFVGGTRLQLELDCQKPGNCDRPIDIGAVRDVLAKEGLANSSVQIVGQEGRALSIRSKSLNVDQQTQLRDQLNAKVGAFDTTKVQIDTVGPTLGRQIFQSGLWALIVAFLGIVLYLTVRFQLDYAVLAILALFHDVLITSGIFALLGVLRGLEVDSLFIVALLTIVGFSVNDTVVIYDRVRETLEAHPHRHINDVVDEAVNQTLARSINTTATTLLSLVAIFLFGGDTLKDFALALIIGFTVGSYSSIFIASTTLAWWRERTGRAILQPEPSEAEIVDASV